jgi:HEAT repeat protein
MLGAMLRAALAACGAVVVMPRAALGQTVQPDAAPSTSPVPAPAPAVPAPAVPAPAVPAPHPSPASAPATAPTSQPLHRDPLTMLRNGGSTPAEQEQAATRLAGGAAEDRVALAAVLSDAANPLAQLAAAKALALEPQPDPLFIPPLLKLSMSEAPQLADAAIKALGRYPDNAQVRAHLMELARDPQHHHRESTRITAIARLGEVPDKTAAHALIELLSSDAESPAIRSAAADALADLTGATEPQRDPAGWERWWSQNQDKSDDQFRLELFAARSAKLAQVELERDRFADETKALLGEVYRATPPAKKEALLLRYLRSTQPEMRATGARLVHEEFTQNNPIPAAVKQQLREMVGDSSARVRVLVANALFDLNDAAALDALLEQLALEKDPEVRAALATALVPIRDARVVEALLRLLNDPSLDVAEVAAHGLRDLGQQMQIYKTDPALAARMARALRETLEQRTGAAGTLNLRAALVDAMAPLHSPDLRGRDGILNRMLLPRESPAVRRAALRALGEYADPAAADAIVNSGALDDADDRVRLEALGALEKTATFNHAELLWGVLKNDPNAAVRDRAWQVLRQVFNDPEAPKESLNRWADRFKGEPQRRLDVLGVLARRLAADKDAQGLATARENIGAELMKLNRPEEADHYFDLALQYYRSKSPTDQDMMTGLLVDQRMDALLASRQYDNAATFAAASITAFGGNGEAVGRKIRNEADRLRNAGKYADAIQLIEAAKKMSPGLPEQFASMLRGIEQDVRQKQQSGAPSSGTR